LLQDAVPTVGKDADMMPALTHTAVYDQLFRLCPALRSEPRWRFLPAPCDCRGPIEQPSRTLAILRQQFSDDQLRTARVTVSGDGGVRLNPSLCRGPIIALRASAGGPPFDLLTVRGCLSDQAPPILAALHDAETLARMHDSGMLFAAARPSDAVWLRRLGLAATLLTGRWQGCLPKIRALETHFGEGFCQDDPPQSTTGHDKPVSSAPLAAGASLVLVGCSRLSELSAETCPLARKVARELVLEQHRLGFRFARIWVWRPAPDDIANLRHRLVYRESDLVREWCLAAREQLQDLTALADSADAARGEAPADFVQAQAELLAALAEDRRLEQASERTQTARELYERSMEQELIQPLQQWAISSEDPIEQNFRIQLGEIFRLLHRLSPHIQEIQARQLAGGPFAQAPPDFAEACSQHAKLCQRAVTLTDAIARHRRSR
jgi:hypothetical protein